MATIPVPSALTFSNVSSFKLQRRSNKLRSRFNAYSQTVVYPYALWVLEATLTDTQDEDAGKIRSFLMKLEGKLNNFRLPVPGYSRPSTGYAGAVNTRAAVSSRASSMLIGGMTASRAIFNEGDFFTINDELKMVTETLASNSSGQGTLSFKPACRLPIASGVALKIINPHVLMTAQDDDIADWSIAPPFRQGGKFIVEEDIPYV